MNVNKIETETAAVPEAPALAFARDLRALAAWYEEHLDAPSPASQVKIHVSATTDDKETAARFARALAPCRKEHGNSLFILARDFGRIELRFIFWRSAVCTRKVVGIKVVPAKPARTVELPAEPERTEEVVEWDCSSILDPEATP